MSDWASDPISSLLLVIGAGILIGVLKEAREAWRQDRPWFGWDLRRLRRHPGDSDPRP